MVRTLSGKTMIPNARGREALGVNPFGRMQFLCRWPSNYNHETRLHKADRFKTRKVYLRENCTGEQPYHFAVCADSERGTFFAYNEVGTPIQIEKSKVTLWEVV